MTSALKAAATLFTVLIFVVIAVVIGWGHFSGDNEKWVHYENHNNPRVLGEYSSHEDCSVAMMSYEGPSGCRRVDGSFGIINRVADKIL